MDSLDDVIFFKLQSLNVHLSESESIKHTLEVERIIDGGCDVLLDTDQKFIREGNLFT